MFFSSKNISLRAIGSRDFDIYFEFQPFLANQIVMRAAFLEEENGQLQKEVEESINTNTIIRNDVTFLSRRLSQYQCNRQPQATAIM